MCRTCALENQKNGVAGLQQAFARHGITQDFDALFADWVIANYANQPDALDQAGHYGYQDFRFGRPRSKRFTTPHPVDPHQATVNNYATDYMRLQGQGNVTVHFSGQTTTQLTAVPVYSGSYAWWSNRGDSSDSRLTRLFDLRSVASGVSVVMEVAMWREIEEHYDYGYVLAGRDGKKWEILPGQRSTTDNPPGDSFGAAYTGKSAAKNKAAIGWVLEQFDLRAYAGHHVWVRFEYITDDVQTKEGWVIDDVRIPAIGYATDFKHGLDGWASEGWLLSDNQLTQRWLLQVMEFADDMLVDLRRAAVDATGQAQIEIPNLNGTGETVGAIS